MVYSGGYVVWWREYGGGSIYICSGPYVNFLIS
jgi:hypothetical protein